MKILIVDNMFSELDNSLSSAGGFERRNLTDAYLLAEKGLDTVYFTHAGPKLLSKRKDFPFTPVRVHDFVAESVDSPAKWRNAVKKNILNWISKHQPDVVLFGSNTMMSLAKDIVETTPLVVHVASFLTGNGFIDSGRMQAFLGISKAGGYFVFNTSATHKFFMDQARDQANKLIQHATFADKVPTFKHFKKAKSFADFINVHNMGVGLIGRRDGEEIRKDRGHVVIASRADPAKLVHKFADIKIPTKIFWKERAVSSKNDYLEKSINKFQINKNVELVMGAPYSDIMRSFASARCCFVTWPDETYGLTAFEAGSFGVPSVVFKRESLTDLNCTTEFLERVYPPSVVSYKSKTWRSDYLHAYEEYESSKKDRILLADKFSDIYSLKNYLSEKRKVLTLGIEKWKTTNG